MTETRRFELARDGEVHVSIPLTITGTLTQPPPPARHPFDSSLAPFSLSMLSRSAVTGALDPDRATDYVVMTSPEPFYYFIAQKLARTLPAGVGDETSTLPQDTLVEYSSFIFSYPTKYPTISDIPDRRYLLTNSLVRIVDGDPFIKDEEVDLWMITTARVYAVAVPIPIVSTDNTSSRTLYISTINEQPVQITTGSEVE